MGIRTVRVDDLDGSEHDVKEVTFGWGGRSYEIDLSETNRTELEKMMGVYVAAARATDGQHPQVPRKRPARPYDYAKTEARRRELAPIKAWAEEQGLWQRPKRGGTVPADVVEAYHQAHR